MGQTINIREHKPLSIWVVIIALTIGAIAFFLAGVYCKVSYDNNKEYYRETTAVIVEIKEIVREDEDKTSIDYIVYVTYTVDETTYENIKLNRYSSNMKVGDEVTITYDMRDPKSLVTSATTILVFSILFIIAGVVCIIFAIVNFTNHTIEVRRHKLFLLSAKVVRVPIVDISKTYAKHKNNNINDNNYVYQLICLYNENLYVSGPFKECPELYCGCTANIYFDKNEFEQKGTTKEHIYNFYVDLSSVEFGPRLEITPEPETDL